MKDKSLLRQMFYFMGVIILQKIPEKEPSLFVHWKIGMAGAFF